MLNLVLGPIWGISLPPSKALVSGNHCLARPLIATWSLCLSLDVKGMTLTFKLGQQREPGLTQQTSSCGRLWKLRSSSGILDPPG